MPAPTTSSRLALVAKVARYAFGSVVALTCSEIALAICYGTGATGTTLASAIAFMAGAIPNYLLNRLWVWRRRGRVRIRRELAPYVAISAFSFGASAVATGWANTEGAHAHLSHSGRIALVGLAYLVTYGTLFVLKFVLYERVVFIDRDRRTIGSR